MIPAGYMYKKVVRRPDWIKSDAVQDIYSLSGCVSEYFAEYINYWKHNGFWLFDTPATIKALANKHQLNLAEAKLFYYEVFEQEYCEDKKEWRPFLPEMSFHTDVEQPEGARLEGYDVVTFTVGTSPECSPLSCCNRAQDFRVNSHCLFKTFDEAKQALDAGAFDHNSEPGPFRIFAVYSFEGS